MKVFFSTAKSQCSSKWVLTCHIIQSPYLPQHKSNHEAWQKYGSTTACESHHITSDVQASRKYFYLSQFRTVCACYGKSVYETFVSQIFFLLCAVCVCYGHFVSVMKNLCLCQMTLQALFVQNLDKIYMILIIICPWDFSLSASAATNFLDPW